MMHIHSNYVPALSPDKNVVIGGFCKNPDYVQSHIFFLHAMEVFLKFLLSTISAHDNVMVKVGKTLWLWQINSIVRQLIHLVKVRKMDVK